MLLLIVFSVPGVCQYTGSETILNYHSDITVNKDSTMLVAETIKVRATGDKIKRGIYRDFPTDYRDKYGNRYVVRFDVTGVWKDGQTEPYHTERQSNGTRLYIGSADVLIPPGVYTYTIKYKTDRQLGFFEDHDELYWNVTGNGWEFTIEKASAAVTLPPGISKNKIGLEAYTGLSGSKDRNYTTGFGQSGRPYFVTTSPLYTNEGMTIVVSWPKGFVTEPSSAMKAGYFFKDNLGIMLGLLGMAMVLIYYIAIWNRIGKDPAKGTIIPLYTPPDGLSPAAVRFIRRMGYDTKAFAAALINMAVKRYIKIDEEKKVYTIVRDTADKSVLSPDEDALISTLLGTNDSLKLSNTHHTQVSGAGNALKKSLDSAYQKTNFNTNGLYMIPAVLVSLIALAASIFLAAASQNPMIIGMGIAFMVITTFSIVIVSQAIRNWRNIFKRVGNAASCIGAGCLTISAIPFIGGAIAIIYIMLTEGSPAVLAIVVLIVLINYIFYFLLKAPTPAGRKLLDQIEGFKMYLSVAEADTLNTMTPPDKTPELFEKYLPYALALDVEQQWAEKFADVLAAAQIDGQNYHPIWYSGSSWNHLAVAGFTSGLGSSFSSAISSSSVAPGSSSGSSGGGGGGGSSGGGGGGGGGGGW